MTLLINLAKILREIFCHFPFPKETQVVGSEKLRRTLSYVVVGDIDIVIVQLQLKIR
jgi:hypothetical protein